MPNCRGLRLLNPFSRPGPAAGTLTGAWTLPCAGTIALASTRAGPIAFASTRARTVTRTTVTARPVARSAISGARTVARTAIAEVAAVAARLDHLLAIAAAEVHAVVRRPAAIAAGEFCCTATLL